MTVTENPIRNSVDTATLFATIEAVRANHEIADFQFRATNTWVSSTHNPIDAGVRDFLERHPEGAAALLRIGRDESQDRNLRPDLAIRACGEKAPVKLPLILRHDGMTPVARLAGPDEDQNERDPEQGDPCEPRPRKIFDHPAAPTAPGLARS